MPERSITGKTALIKAILDDNEDNVIEEEEMIHLLLEQKVSKNTSEQSDSRLTLGQHMADGIAKSVGSWRFILIFISCLVAWVILNILLFTKAFDPYPFILLNLLLSCVAAIQAPVIMMSQNRQEEKDRMRSLNDYKTNLKAEIIVEDIHYKIDQLLTHQEQVLKQQEQVLKQQERLLKQFGKETESTVQNNP